MFISLLFSIGLYQVSTQEIERGIRAHGPVGQVLRTRNAEFSNDLIEEQDEIINEASKRIQSSLVLINVVILVGGGFLSYHLAKRTLKPIEDAHEAQSRFTADASHELRTPIAAMRIENELALTDDKLTLKKAKQQLQSNIEEIDKLTELSDGLLQLAQLDNNGVEQDTVSISHVVTQAVEQVQTKTDQRHQTIRLSTIPDIEVRASQPALVRALVTLLDNAIKYSPEKSEIHLTFKTARSSIHISVTDNGSGIRASDLPHIFDRFYRADSSRNKNQINGYGIGLSIAKSIIELHDGKISVSSVPDKGSTFTVSLPIT